MIGEILSLKADLDHLKTAFGNALKIGAVQEIDGAKGYRLKLGEGPDGEPFLSPWMPHPETGKSSIPLKKGQIVGVINPNGDMRQGLVFRGGYSDEHKSPNEDMEVNVFEDAGVRIQLAAGALSISVDGVTIVVSGAGLSVTGGRVEHDGRNIGSDHVHGGVEKGGALTAPPAN
jgi:phage baseplate assembly protein gpV